jgi:hypothetical protein
MLRLLACAVVVAAAPITSACGSQVSCANLCQHTQACNVTFRPTDDEDGALIRSGARSTDQDCVLGCEENPAVTVDSAKCIDDATAKSADPAVCQAPVLACLGQK